MNIDTKEFRDLLGDMLDAYRKELQGGPALAYEKARPKFIAHIDAQLGAARAAALEEAARLCETEICACCWSSGAEDAALHLAEEIRALATQAAPTQAAPSLGELLQQKIKRDAALSVSDQDERALFEAAWRKRYQMPDELPFSKFVQGQYDAPAVDDAFTGWQLARSLAHSAQAAQGSGVQADLLRELRAARRALRQIKRASNQFTEAREISTKAEKRATAAILAASPAPSAAPAHGQWVSVKDRLPPRWGERYFSESVLIVDMDSRYPHVRMSELNFDGDEPTVWTGAAPTHWMPPPALPGAAPAQVAQALTRCAAGRDGECGHAQCPQLRDGEPAATGRHCPLDREGGHHAD